MKSSFILNLTSCAAPGMLYPPPPQLGPVGVGDVLFELTISIVGSQCIFC